MNSKRMVTPLLPGFLFILIMFGRTLADSLTELESVGYRERHQNTVTFK